MVKTTLGILDHLTLVRDEPSPNYRRTEVLFRIQDFAPQFLHPSNFYGSSLLLKPVLVQGRRVRVRPLTIYDMEGWEVTGVNMVGSWNGLSEDDPRTKFALVQ